MNASDIEKLEQAIDAHQKARPEDRTFKLLDPQGRQLWVKTLSSVRLRALYSITNRLMVWGNMPYFQAPPHAGGPGGTASLQIEKEMLLRLKAAKVPVPEVIACHTNWLALSTVGEKDLDVALNELAEHLRLELWQQAVEAIAYVHRQGCCLSQCFARNIMLKKMRADKTDTNELTPFLEDRDPQNLKYQLYFLDFEEDPTKVMTLAQAQARDWAMFLHSTATLVAHDMVPAQQFLLELLQKETTDAQQITKKLFKKLMRLQWLKHLQWLGRDSIRLYQLGVFSAGIYDGLCEGKIK